MSQFSIGIKLLLSVLIVAPGSVAVTYPSAVNLRVVNVTHTGQTSSVTVAWDPPRGVTAHQVSKYIVQIQSSRDPSIFRQLTVGSNLTHTFERLKPEILYSIDVIVSYEGGTSDRIRITVRLDYNECKRRTHKCDHICTDTPTSYLCSCKSGYTLKNQYQCIDVDECQSDTDGCQHNCTNTDGSYECYCLDGYRLDTDNHSCTDINECEDDQDDCAHICKNLNGSYNCSCMEGYKLGDDEHSCHDDDECQSNTDECQHNCSNTDGSYECYCRDGYRLGTDNHSCTDINECESEDFSCSINKFCSNTPGGYECLSCRNGFGVSHDQLRCILNLSTSNLETLAKDFIGVSEKNAQQLLNLSVGIASALTDGIQAISFDNDSASVDLYSSYANLFGAIVNLRRRSGEFNSSLPPSEDDGLINSLVNITGSLLSSNVISQLTDNTTKNALADSVTKAVIDVESLATVIASTLEEGNQTAKSLSSGNIKIQVKAIDEGKNVTFEDESTSIQFSFKSLDLGQPMVITSVSLGKVGDALPKKTSEVVKSGVVSVQLLPLNSVDVTPLNTSSTGSHPVEIEFTILDVTDLSLIECVFYEYDHNENPIGWSTTGLIKEVKNSSVVCKSNHLTSFAVLVNVGGVKHDDVTEAALRYFTYIGIGLSIVCLFITVVALSCFRCKGQKTPLNFVHINLSLTLLIALVIFGGGSWYARHIKILCSVLAGLLHYFFLAVFSWMLCEGVMLYLMVVKVFSQLPKKLWFFLLLGYGLPIPAIIVGAAVRYKQYGGEEFGCFLSPAEGTIWAFGGPVLGIIVVNAVFLVMALVQLFRTQKDTVARSSSNIQIVKTTVKAAILLLPIMGLTWVFGFISLDYGVDALRTLTLIFNIIFIVLNSLQGVFIFFFYVLRNEKLKPLWRKFCPTAFNKRWQPASSSTTKSSGVKSTIEMGTFGSVKEAITHSEVEKDVSPEKFSDEMSITEEGLNSPSGCNGLIIEESQEVKFMYSDNDSAAVDYTFSLKEAIVSTTAFS